MISQPVELLHLVESLPTLVVVERVRAQLLRTGVSVKGGVHRGWRTGLVHQRDREKRGCNSRGGEHGDVEVRKGAEDTIDMVPVHGEVGRELGVRQGRGDLGGPAEIGQERHVGEHSGKVIPQTRHRQRDPTALASARHSDAIAIHARKLAHRVDGEHSVGEDPAVVVGRRVEDAAGQVPRVGGLGPGRVRCVADENPEP